MSITHRQAADSGRFTIPTLVSLAAIGSSSIEHIQLQWLMQCICRVLDTTNQGTIGSKCAIEVCQHHPLANLALIGMIANKFIVKAGNIDWKYHIRIHPVYSGFCPAYSDLLTGGAHHVNGIGMINALQPF